MFCLGKNSVARQSMCIACILTTLAILAMLVVAIPHVMVVVFVSNDPDTVTVTYKDTSYVL